MPSALVLLANDDGYASPGIRAMRAALIEAGAEVIVLAPEAEQSASSHALSLHRSMRLREVEAGVFALDGTPADCVYVALHAGARVLPRRPDLVVSGINNGMNLGQDAFYSARSPPRARAPCAAFPRSRPALTCPCRCRASPSSVRASPSSCSPVYVSAARRPRAPRW
jgi:hypothetical protein